MRPAIDASWRADTPAGGNRGVSDALGGLVGIGALVVATVAAPLHAAMEQAGPGDGTASSTTARRGGFGMGRTVAPGREVLIAAYFGAPYTYPSDVSVKKAGQHDFSVAEVAWDGQPFKSPIYYGARVVRWFEGGATGAMLDFTHSKAIARLREEKSFSGTLDGAPAPAKAMLGDVFRRLEFSHGHNMLTLNGLWRLPLRWPRLSPYVGAGVGVNLPHTEVQLKTDKQRTYEYQYTGPVVQALVGVELRLPRMSYFLEYKFSLARYDVPLTHRNGALLVEDLWHQFARWWSGNEPVGGRLDTTLTSHQIVGGLGVRVGETAAPAR